MKVLTIGHGTRPIEELLICLEAASARTLVDVRRFPSSRRNPQFNRAALAEALASGGITYHHAVDLGGRRGDPTDGRFAGLGSLGGYAAWMGTELFEAALREALAFPAPCLMCAETLFWKCHRLLIADLVVARGHEVVHLIRPNEARRHALSEDAEICGGRLYLGGELVA